MIDRGDYLHHETSNYQLTRGNKATVLLVSIQTSMFRKVENMPNHPALCTALSDHRKCSRDAHNDSKLNSLETRNLQHRRPAYEKKVSSFNTFPAIREQPNYDLTRMYISDPPPLGRHFRVWGGQHFSGGDVWGGCIGHPY